MPRLVPALAPPPDVRAPVSGMPAGRASGRAAPVLPRVESDVSQSVRDDMVAAGRPRMATRRDEKGPRMSDVVYAVEPDLNEAEFVDVLERSTLAERRPVGDPETILGMLRHADLIVTARSEGRLVGISRAITDFNFCTYLSDLAVDVTFQKRGIGRELIRLTHEAAGLKTMLILLAAPAARGYYPHIGMASHDSCWVIPRQA